MHSGFKRFPLLLIFRNASKMAQTKGVPLYLKGRYSFLSFIIHLIMKNPKTTTEKPVPKAEQSVATVVTKATPKKPSPNQKNPKKAQVVAPKPVATKPEMTVPEHVGLTAGSIWHYLALLG